MGLFYVPSGGLVYELVQKLNLLTSVNNFAVVQVTIIRPL
jgi:hypothetical protein